MFSSAVMLYHTVTKNMQEVLYQIPNGANYLKITLDLPLTFYLKL